MNTPISAANERHEHGNLQRDHACVRIDPDDLGLHVARLTDQELFELRRAQDLRVLVEAVCDLLLFGGREHRTRLGHAREGQLEGRQHDGSGERQTEREAERATRRVHACGFAHVLLIDRRQGVVVELGDEQTQPGTCDHQRHEEVPACVAARHDHDQ